MARHMGGGGGGGVCVCVWGGGGGYSQLYSSSKQYATPVATDANTKPVVRPTPGALQGEQILCNVFQNKG